MTNRLIITVNQGPDANKFAWMRVNDKAKEIFNSGLFELYILHPDNTESLIESIDQLNEETEKGQDIVIEVGKIL